MKGQEETLAPISLQRIDQSFNGSQIKCTNSNSAILYCANQSCLSTKPFQCGQRRCKCRQGHKLCLKADIDSTLEIIKSKIIDTEEIKKIIESSFNNLIDSLSNTRQKIMVKIDSQLKYYRLQTVEKIFLSILNLELNEAFTSKSSAYLWKTIKSDFVPKFDTPSQITRSINEFQQLITQSIESFELEVDQVFQNNQFIIKCSQKQKQQTIQQVFRRQQQQKQDFIQQVFKRQSSILTDKVHVQRLKRMLPGDLSTARLLFKASEHKFRINKFYEICGNEAQTVIVLKTNKDKIMGGYTPLKFSAPTTNGRYVSDESNKSFIFSLSQNDKFQLKDKRRAIYSSISKSYLCFGNTQIQIKDKSSEDNSCNSYLSNPFYWNQKYEDNQDSYIKLNGNQNQKFSTKEWEVWKIQLLPRKA